jgi:hypothetical protein
VFSVKPVTAPCSIRAPTRRVPWRGSGAERLPDARVQVAPCRHLATEVGNALVERANDRALAADLIAERDGLAREVAKLDVMDDEESEDDGRETADSDGGLPGIRAGP